MKKILMAILLASGSIVSNGALASLDFGEQTLNNPAPEVVNQALNYLLHTTVGFRSINHATFFDPSGQPSAPAPGNTFVIEGFATADSPAPGVEFSLRYDIAGTFVGVDPATGSLFIDHGLAKSGVSNSLVLYVDDSPDADEDDADTYTDGAHLATLEVVYPSPDRGILTLTGGEDHVTFRLSDADRDRFGLPEDFYVELSSTLELGNFDFGAFNGACIPALDNCIRESGSLRFYMAQMPTAPVPVPVPAILYLFLLGGGLLQWTRRRNRG